MTTFRRVTVAAAAALLLVLSSAALSSADAQGAAQGLAGEWSLTATGTPHGDLHFLARFTPGAGKSLTATVTLFDNPIEMTGETTGGAFSVSGQGGGGVLTLSGKLKADDTLEGFLSNEQGDLLFTGKRAK